MCSPASFTYKRIEYGYSKNLRPYSTRKCGGYTMTLILARASAEYVLQVTDRLVSKGKQPHDRVANKNVLLFAKNAVVSMAYTGHAYLQDIPTDQWIAEKLTGIAVDKENPKSFHFGKTDLSWRDIGHSLLILTDQLTRRRKAQDFTLFITVTGWQWNSKGRFRPLDGLIGPVRGNRAFGVQYEPRHWYWRGECRTSATPLGHIFKDELAELSSSLLRKPASEAEGLLVNKIREVSRRSSVVGPHCISILLPPPSNPTITVRYHMATPSESSKSHELAGDQRVWGYSPWIIGPRSCNPPQMIVGGLTIKLGPFSIQYASNADKNPGYLFAVKGQKRPNSR